jgi:hypothetical protein
MGLEVSVRLVKECEALEVFSEDVGIKFRTLLPEEIEWALLGGHVGEQFAAGQGMIALEDNFVDVKGFAGLQFLDFQRPGGRAQQ